MKRLSTKSIESLLIATSATLKDIGADARQRHLERILQRHDRKGELRASVFGIDPLEFRALRKGYSFDEMMKIYGFRSQHEFLIALMGRLRAELLQRGWSRQRINLLTTPRLLFAA